MALVRTKARREAPPPLSNGTIERKAKAMRTSAGAEGSAPGEATAAAALVALPACAASSLAGGGALLAPEPAGGWTWRHLYTCHAHMRCT